MTTTLGSYELGEVLGRGSMGEVHRGARIGSGDQIAVKILRPELVSDPELIARFLQERTVLCGLSHPNLVRVHDLVVEGGSAAIVMDLVDGSDLRRRLTLEGTLAPADAVRLVIQLLHALTTVHAMDIVHRDIKPENVLLGTDGEVRLTDFGIARLTHGPSLTRMTGLIGTPEYLAPELAEREHATPAADVYAVGILLYELLTGFTPFSGGHPVAVLRRHLEDDPPRPGGIPDPLWNLLASMLNKDPAARPTAIDAAERLSAMTTTLQGLRALAPTKPARDFEESPTSMKIRGVDSQERATVIRGSRSKNRTAQTHTRRYRVLMVGAAVVVLAGVLAGVLVSLGSSASAHRPATFAFKPQSYPSGLIVDRTWTLSGTNGNQLHAKVILTNGSPTAFNNTPYDEVIPKEVASSVRNVSFTPTPDQIIKTDPVVRYDLNLASGAPLKISYGVNVGPTKGSWASRLKQLAKDQIEAQTAYLQASGQQAPVTLASLGVTPTALSLTVGVKPQTLTVSGVMSDGSQAVSAELTGVSWTTANPSVATVSSSGETVNLVAVAAGSTTISAQAGSLTTTVDVTVSAPAGQSSAGATIGATRSPATKSTSAPRQASGSPTTKPKGVTQTQTPSQTTTSKPTSSPTPTQTSAPNQTPTPTPTQTSTPDQTVPCPGCAPGRSPDINHDGLVNCADLDIMLAYWGANYPPADLNGNGVVDIFDLSILLDEWTPGQPSSSCSSNGT